MIHKVECVTLSCDNCKKDFVEYHNGFSIFVDENSAYEEASNDNWFRDKDKCYCPDCYSFDEEENLIIKKLEVNENTQKSTD